MLKGMDDHRFPFVECFSCSHRYMNPMPTASSLEAYYNEDYFCVDDTAKYNQQRALGLADRFFFRLCRVRPAKPHSRVLEIGPGNGKHLLWLRQLGHNVQGMDLGAHERVERGEDIPIQVGRPEQWSAEEESFDMVFCYWVLEHVRGTRDILTRCRRWLKPGGRIAAGLTNVDCPEAKWFGDYWHHAVVPDHVSQFNMNSATVMMDKAGFVLISQKYDLLSFDFQLNLRSWLKGRYGLDTPLDHNLVKLASLPMAPVKSALGWSGLITLVGEKPG